MIHTMKMDVSHAGKFPVRVTVLTEWFDDQRAARAALAANLGNPHCIFTKVEKDGIIAAFKVIGWVTQRAD